MKKAIFFDIDGTLLDIVNGWDVIQPEVKGAIRRLQEAGHRVFIATGRPYSYLSEEFRNFGFDGFVLMNGGAILLDGEVIFKQTLPEKSLREICRLAEEGGIDYVLQDAKQVYLGRDCKRLEEFYERIGIPTKDFVRDFHFAEVDTCKMEFISSEEKGGGYFERMLEQEGVTGWMDPYHGCNLEIYGTAESKGSAILRVCEILGIPREESYAFGDGFNDIEMMAMAGTSFAMGNGRDEVKAAATYVVPSVREHGVAYGIERYILKGADVDER